MVVVCGYHVRDRNGKHTRDAISGCNHTRENNCRARNMGADPARRLAGSHRREGRAGKPVLLADSRDDLYFRLYQPRAGGSWAGVSQRVGHRELTPETDGVRIVARLRYLDLG
jgi:hypothetical protein